MNRRLSALSPFSMGFADNGVPGRATPIFHLPHVFSSHMVLQRDQHVPVWGWAPTGDIVTVSLGSHSATATADKEGRWMAMLPPMPASATPMTMTVHGQITVTFTDVLVGDVWLCSGQSNMEWTLGDCACPDDVAQASVPTIRCVKVPHVGSPLPLRDFDGTWRVCTPDNAKAFTAVGYYFAREVGSLAQVPIGIIDVNWGGTCIEPWWSSKGPNGIDELKGILAKHEEALAAYRVKMAYCIDAIEQRVRDVRCALAENTNVPPAPAWPEHPGNAGGPFSLYNGMIHPLVPYGIKGALWYQGESNGDDDDIYYHKMRALIGGWRTVWHQGDFPFYYVQLANWQQPNPNPAGGDGWAKIRCAQTKAMTIPRTGMAVTIDIGDADDIHPKNKFDVGYRLALWALAHDYGKEGIVYSGPLYKGMTVEGTAIRLQFDHVGGGLMAGMKDGRTPACPAPDGVLKGFAIAGTDNQWQWAHARIDGTTVLVSHPHVPQPVAVRYAYSINPAGANLYNREGLPASPFTTT